MPIRSVLGCCYQTATVGVPKCQRNLADFKGRQGSPTGRTLLMSPAMVAAAALNGCVTDVREMLQPVEV